MITQKIPPNKQPVIAISMGDPGGIGPEVLLKSFPRVQKILSAKKGKRILFLCIGSFTVLSAFKKRWQLRCPIRLVAAKEKKGELDWQAFASSSYSANVLNVLEPQDIASDFLIGGISKTNAQTALASLALAAQLVKDGQASALVTAPLNKAACRLLEPSFTGHTAYLTTVDGAKQHAMLLSGKGLRVVLVTEHLALREVARYLNKKLILEKIVLADNFLRKYAAIRCPRIGVAGLNPHAGEAGEFGEEDAELILPAVQAARRKGIKAFGPVPADTVFYQALSGQYDLVVAMYHDQGLAPLKTLAFESAVNTTIGLSFYRTSPDHGTAFDIAWKNRANPESMIQAMLQAAAICCKDKK